jgi:hypothetical protein
MISQSELADRFYDNCESGVASNMEIATFSGGGVAVVGYAHAVYAYRPPDDRFDPVVFVGWLGASKSTNQHIHLLKRDEAIEIDGRPNKGDIVGDPDLKELSAIDSNDRDYGGVHSRRDDDVRI